MKPSFTFFIFYFCFVFWFNDLLKPYQPHKNETNFVWDACGYYSYLPATFYYSGTFEFNNGYETFLPLNFAGKRYPKYTYGVALLEAPFYGIGYIVAKLSGKPVNGFSTPFADSVRWGCVLYTFIGLWFLRKFLLRFFNELVTAITLFCCFFGTMLYMYTYVQGEISHGYLFVLFSMFLYYTAKWHDRPSFRYSLYLSALLGLISIIRVSDIYIALVFIFWNVKKPEDFKHTFYLLKANIKHLILFPVIGFLFWIPQFIFWKKFLGAYLTDTYIGEYFFWGDPQILNILFSYRKGWITYTPLVLLAFAGLFFIKRNFPLHRFFFFGILAFTIYVFSCWWDWNYGGGFGSRPFCPLIALLSIPFATLTNLILYEFKWASLTATATVLFFILSFSCVFYNFSLSYQYQELRSLHPYHTGRYSYWGAFRQFHYSPEYHNSWWGKLSVRDDKAWIKGIGRDDEENGKIYEFWVK